MYILFIMTLNLFYVACTVIFVISFLYVCRSKSPTGLMFDVYYIRRLVNLLCLCRSPVPTRLQEIKITEWKRQTQIAKEIHKRNTAFDYQVKKHIKMSFWHLAVMIANS